MSDPLTKTSTSHRSTADSGAPNMPALMEGLAQVQDGLRTMVKAGAVMPRPRSLPQAGLFLVLLQVPGHQISVMDGDKPGTLVFAVDDHPVMEGWPE